MNKKLKPEIALEARSIVEDMRRQGALVDTVSVLQNTEFQNFYRRLSIADKKEFKYWWTMF